MKRAVVGMVAHVDAGKTSLVEAMLFRAGVIRRRGRVDHGDTFLDTDDMERRRGITIFARPARLVHHDVCLTLLDTPGHADLVAEAERVMPVLDYAIYVLGANDPISGHAVTLWRLLGRHGVPAVIFVNKMDLATTDRETLLAGLKRRLGDTCFDATQMDARFDWETVALADEAALEEYLSTGVISRERLRSLVARRKVTPCFFGSALRDDGIDELLDGVAGLLVERRWPNQFGARVYKVSHDRAGERLSWLKVTGGALEAKRVLQGRPTAAMGGDTWSDKVDQLRIYNGDRFEVAQRVEAGDICAATGLMHVSPGDGIGADGGSDGAASLLPVLSYGVRPVGCDAHTLHVALGELADEDPLLGVSWQEEAQETQLRLMGPVQLEVVQEQLLSRFGLAVTFDQGAILYRETIAAPALGIGHFEPLRHYAEVHVLVEPTGRGSGVSFGSVCGEDDLDRNWQRLIMTNAMEREHRGTLIGAPITDVRITLVAGRAHAKHTEGGDFRQATYRAIRNALMQATGVLLEPCYHFELEVPSERVGRALSDLQRMCATFSAPTVKDGVAVVMGSVPVSELGDYAVQVSAYTAGEGRLLCLFDGYGICHDAERVIEAAAYDPRADLPNTPDSVFCSHGAGYTVAWDEVAEHAHIRPDPARRHPWRPADVAFFSNVAASDALL